MMKFLLIVFCLFMGTTGSRIGKRALDDKEDELSCVHDGVSYRVKDIIPIPEYPPNSCYCNGFGYIECHDTPIPMPLLHGRNLADEAIKYDNFTCTYCNKVYNIGDFVPVPGYPNNTCVCEYFYIDCSGSLHNAINLQGRSLELSDDTGDEKGIGNAGNSGNCFYNLESYPVGSFVPLIGYPPKSCNCTETFLKCKIYSDASFLEGGSEHCYYNDMNFPFGAYVPVVGFPPNSCLCTTGILQCPQQSDL